MVNMFGIGTDIIEIKRISDACNREGFLKKIFTQKEQEYFKNKKYNSMAANFAGKEAVSKAFGTGFSCGVTPVNIEILRDDTGKPYVNLHGEALVLFKSLNLSKIHISLSHSMEYAIAYVMME